MSRGLKALVVVAGGLALLAANAFSAPRVAAERTASSSVEVILELDRAPEAGSTCVAARCFGLSHRA